MLRSTLDPHLHPRRHAHASTQAFAADIERAFKRAGGAILALALVVFAAWLVSCAPPQEQEATQEETPLEAFSGTWNLIRMSYDGRDASESDLARLKDEGLEVYLGLDEEGTATFSLFGEVETGEWEAQTTETAALNLRDQDIDLAIQDGELFFEQSGAELWFAKENAQG